MDWNWATFAMGAGIGFVSTIIVGGGILVCYAQRHADDEADDDE